MVLQNQEMLEATIKCAHINDHLWCFKLLYDIVLLTELHATAAAMEEYTDYHRYVLQSFMSRGILNVRQVKELYKNAFRIYNPQRM